MTTPAPVDDSAIEKALAWHASHQPEYLEELNAFDEIDVLMTPAYVRQHRIGLDFDIVKLHPTGSLCAARGFQEIGCMRATDQGLVPTRPPASLMHALEAYVAASASVIRIPHDGEAPARVLNS